MVGKIYVLGYDLVTYLIQHFPPLHLSIASLVMSDALLILTLFGRGSGLVMKDFICHLHVVNIRNFHPISYCKAVKIVQQLFWFWVLVLGSLLKPNLWVCLILSSTQVWITLPAYASMPGMHLWFQSQVLSLALSLLLAQFLVDVIFFFAWFPQYTNTPRDFANA